MAAAAGGGVVFDEGALLKRLPAHHVTKSPVIGNFSATGVLVTWCTGDLMRILCLLSQKK